MSKTAKVLIIAAFLATVGFGAYALWCHLRPLPRTASLSKAEKLELLRLKNEALAYLENLDFKKAAELFEQIVQALPDEPMAYRNLALAIFEPGDNGFSGRKDSKNLASMQPVLSAVDVLIQKEPDSSAAYFLAGLAHAEQADLTRIPAAAAFTQAQGQMQKHLRRAAKLSPDDPAPLFTLYWIEKQWGDSDKITDECLALLQAAATRAPESLVISLDLALWLALRQDARCKAFLDRAIKELPVSRKGADDPNALLRRAQELLQLDPKTVHPEVGIRVRGAINVLKSHPAYQQELRRLKLHPLEFTQPDFRPEFYTGLEAETAPTIPVKFELASEETGKDSKAMPVVAALHEEINSDDADFVPYRVVLRTGGGKTRVELTQPKSVPGDSQQRPFEPFETQGEFTSFRLADLDLDWAAPRKTGQPNTPADLDLVLFGSAGVRVLENTSAGGKVHWVDRTGKADLPALADVQWLLVCDMDHEGNLDLIAGLSTGVRVLRNRGAWSFDDVTPRSPGLESLETRLAVYGDFDRDGDLDFYLLDSENRLVLLENRRSGRFAIKVRDGTFPGARSLLAADVTHDGRLDLLLGHSSGVTVLAQDRDGGVFEVHKLRFFQPHAVLELGGFDYDNDGRLDLWARVAEPQNPLRVFRNLGGLGEMLFENVSDKLPAVLTPLSTVQPADLDDDGDLDLVLAGPAGVQVVRNQGGNKNHWLSFRLRAHISKETEGGQAAKCNYFNVGGQIEIKSGLHYQMQPVIGTRTHFGLGGRKRVEAARVLWTNGVPGNVIRPGVDTILTEEQKPKGSCPFLYTWDGQQFVFVTDCLWSSGLGMKQTHGVDMPHDRQYNYLVIAGNQLKPRDDRYVLQFTNELWECPFLDQVQLWVVDHPADVEVYTNQRVPPDPKEEFKLLTVKQRRYPRAASDHQGRDVLSVVNQRDGRCVGGFRRTRYVGLAEPHWLQLDLGDLSKVKTATLYLTGWIWPTDTSGNVAISQDPRFRAPVGVIGGAQPPALLVPDGKGGWAAANPMMGFPSGKLQTVAVPLPLEKFPPGDYRVRIATMMELYWDEVFFTVDEPQTELKITRLPVIEADLHYRGYSRVHQESRESPILFDYNDVDPGPRWLPVPGPFTRFGPVTELLHRPDSQYVVMSVGDELTLSFEALPPPAPGHRRTFVFYANGWLKDFDMNGEASDGVAPLPFEGMSRYPFDPRAERLPEPLRQFHDRYTNRGAERERFWDALRPK